jgi:hypothetical protein
MNSTREILVLLLLIMFFVNLPFIINVSYLVSRLTECKQESLLTA